MRDKYASKWGFDKIPDWKAVTSRTLIRKVFPLLLLHDPTLHWRKPEDVGWEQVGKVRSQSTFLLVHLRAFSTTRSS